MRSQEEIDEQVKLLAAHRRTLANYLHQLANIGLGYAPPGLLNGMSEARDAIRHIKATLRGWGVPVDDHPNDEAPASQALSSRTRVRALFWPVVAILALFLAIGTLAWLVRDAMLASRQPGPPPAASTLPADAPTAPGATPRPTAIIPVIPAEETIEDVFPMAMGNSWTYIYTRIWQPDAQPDDLGIPEMGVFTETVILRQTHLVLGSTVATIEQVGESFRPLCGGLLQSKQKRAWYLLQKQRMFQTCDQEALEKGLVETRELPLYVAPFKVGSRWPAIQREGSTCADDVKFCWSVDALEDVSVQAGDFQNCYKIIERDNTGHIIRWVCPGIGRVAEEYYHHGTRITYRVELISYVIR